MKKSELRVGFVVISTDNGEGRGRPLQITHIDSDFEFLEIGPFVKFSDGFGLRIISIGELIKDYKIFHTDETFEDITYE